MGRHWERVCKRDPVNVLFLHNYSCCCRCVGKYNAQRQSQKVCPYLIHNTRQTHCTSKLKRWQKNAKISHLRCNNKNIKSIRWSLNQIFVVHWILRNISSIRRQKVGGYGALETQTVGPFFTFPHCKETIEVENCRSGPLIGYSIYSWWSGLKF